MICEARSTMVLLPNINHRLRPSLLELKPGRASRRTLRHGRLQPDAERHRRRARRGPGDDVVVPAKVAGSGGSATDAHADAAIPDRHRHARLDADRGIP